MEFLDVTPLWHWRIRQKPPLKSRTCCNGRCRWHQYCYCLSPADSWLYPECLPDCRTIFPPVGHTHPDWQTDWQTHWTPADISPVWSCWCSHTDSFTALLAYPDHKFSTDCILAQPYSNGLCHVHLIMMYHILRIHQFKGTPSHKITQDTFLGTRAEYNFRFLILHKHQPSCLSSLPSFLE